MKKESKVSDIYPEYVLVWTLLLGILIGFAEGIKGKSVKAP